MLQEADALFKTILTPETLQSSNLIPLEWLDWQDTDESPDAIREVYLQLSMRLNHSQIFIKAQNARETLILSTPLYQVESVKSSSMWGLLFLQKRSL
jgi:hypothetical protein